MRVINANCPVCGKEFVKRKVWAVFCSHQCRTKHSRLTNPRYHYERKKKWTEENRERVRAYQRMQILKFPERFKEKWRRARLKHYGPTWAQIASSLTEEEVIHIE